MNRIGTVIFFVILFLLIIALYAYMYHFKKKKTMAIVLAAILGVGTLLSIIFVLPFPNRSEIIDIKTTNATIQKIGARQYVVCDDGTKYELKAMNTKMSSKYFSYRNDDMYANEKVELVRRYNYKIWGFIPAYSLEHETQIYLDNDEFENIYGCDLDVNENHR